MNKYINKIKELEKQIKVAKKEEESFNKNYRRISELLRLEKAKSNRYERQIAIIKKSQSNNKKVNVLEEEIRFLKKEQKDMKKELNLKIAENMKIKKEIKDVNKYKQEVNKLRKEIVEVNKKFQEERKDNEMLKEQTMLLVEEVETFKAKEAMKPKLEYQRRAYNMPKPEYIKTEKNIGSQIEKFEADIENLFKKF